MTQQMTLHGEASIDDIVPNPDNVRRDLGDLTDLAASIADHGVLEPVVVYRRTVPESVEDQRPFMLVFGHRRLAATRLAGLDTIPVIERSEPDRIELLEIMVAENNHRSDLTVIDEGLALVEIKKAGRRTLKAIAAAVNRSQSWCAQRMAIVAKIPESVWPQIASGDVSVSDAVTVAQTKGLSAAQRAEVLNAPAAQRAGKIDQIVRAAKERARLDEVAAAWPGRKIVTDNPQYHSTGVESVYGLATYGESPGQINTPPEMADPDTQIVFLDRWRSAADPVVYCLTPEQLPIESFVAREVELGDEQIGIDSPEFASVVRCTLLANAPTDLGGYKLARIHELCPGHRELVVPWSSAITYVCTTPEVHEDESTWAALVEQYDAQTESEKAEREALPPAWRRTLGPTLADLAAARLEAIVESIDPAIVALLIAVDPYDFDYRSVDDEDAPGKLDVGAIVEGMSSALGMAVDEFTHSRDEDMRTAYGLPCRWLETIAGAEGVALPESLSKALTPPTPADVFVQLLEEAMSAGGTQYSIDESEINALGAELANDGWTVDSDTDGGEFVVTITDEAGRTVTLTTGAADVDSND